MISEQQLGHLKLGRQFDLIWIGWLITHFDEQRTRKLLSVMQKYLLPNGVLVVSSHGEFASEQIANNHYGLGGELSLNV